MEIDAKIIVQALVVLLVAALVARPLLRRRLGTGTWLRYAAIWCAIGGAIAVGYLLWKAIGSSG